MKLKDLLKEGSFKTGSNEDSENIKGTPGEPKKKGQFQTNDDDLRGYSVNASYEVNPTQDEINTLAQRYSKYGMTQHGGFTKDLNKKGGLLVRYTAIPRKDAKGNWIPNEKGYVYFFSPNVIHMELAKHVLRMNEDEMKKAPIIHGIAEKRGNHWITKEAHNLKYKVNDKIFNNVDWSWLDEYLPGTSKFLADKSNWK